ncbi:hypothetical protein ACLKA6_014173 [Drosophila palustris]
MVKPDAVVVVNDNDDDVVDNGDEILKNIIKSNERLSQELAKMPPLPKLTSYKEHRSHNTNNNSSSSNRSETTATTTTAMGAKPKCFCPSFMRHKHEHEHVHATPAMRHRSEISATCCGNSSNSRCRSGKLARTQTTSHSKSKHCHAHEFTIDTHHEHRQQQHQQYRTAPATTTATTCCHPHKTELLPWLQQHLVLNQTISSANSCQPPCQTSHLTVDADTAATATATATSTTTATATCKGRNSNALSASIKPKHYFEQLLQRDGCHRKPRPPVKVDVNVRLVPKQSKPKVSVLNDTFVNELDEMAHALNETFVKDKSPELAEIDEQLAQFENAVVDDDGQEQATKL